MNVEDLPPGWVASALSDVAQINPPLDRCVVNDDVPVAFIPMRAVEPEGGGVVSPEVRRYAEVKKGYTSFLSKDVVMAKITPCMENGKTAVVPDVAGQVCFGSTEFHAILPEPGAFSPKWIAQFLLQHEIRRSAQRQMTGGWARCVCQPHFWRRCEFRWLPLLNRSASPTHSTNSSLTSTLRWRRWSVRGRS